MENIIDFIYEIGQLKRIPHIGWLHAGVRDPERVGEHVFRATQIAYILAELEGADVSKTTLMTLIHDNGEARIGDHDLLTQQYVDGKKAEQDAFNDQCLDLPKHIGQKWGSLFKERESLKTLEAKCSRDADLLEQAFQAKEYLEQGYKNVQRWLDNIGTSLSTASAKKLFTQMKKRGCIEWLKKAMEE